MDEVMNSPERIGQTPEFLYVIDLDRTLIDSPVAAKAVYQAAEEVVGLSKTELEEIQTRVEDANRPFDVVEALEERLSSRGIAQEDLADKLDDIKAKFLEIIGEPETLLYEGAKELLDQLESDDIYIPYVIATYGGTSWQRWKLEAAGLLDKDFIITNTELEKGAWIAREWRMEDGTYAPPFEDEEHRQRLKAWHVVVIDDKRKSFQGLPPGNITILVRHKGMPVTSVQEEGNFQPDLTAGGLWDVTARLNMPGKEIEL